VIAGGVISVEPTEDYPICISVLDIGVVDQKNYNHNIANVAIVENGLDVEEASSAAVQFISHLIQ
jgi:hypothetical protein